MNINELLDEAKQLGKIPSDTKLGGELGCSQVVIHNWRNGKGEPDKYACWRLAEITGRDLYEIIAIIEAERDKRPEVKAFFEKILETGAYKKVAVAIVGAAALASPFGVGGVEAEASFSRLSSVYYVK